MNYGYDNEIGIYFFVFSFQSEHVLIFSIWRVEMIADIWDNKTRRSFSIDASPNCDEKQGRILDLNSRGVQKFQGAERRRKTFPAFMTFLRSFSLFLKVLLFNKSDIVVFYQIKPAAGEIF